MLFQLPTAILLALLGLAAAQSSIPEQCLYPIMSEIVVLTNAIHHSLLTLEHDATEGTINSIRAAREDVEESTSEYIAKLNEFSDLTNDELLNCGIDIGCVLEVVKSVADLTGSVPAQLTEAVTTNLHTIRDTVSGIVTVNTANLSHTLQAIDDLLNYISTNAFDIHNCLIVFSPHLGTLFG